MSDITTFDWDHGTKSGFVSIGTHKLWLHVSGPDRAADKPVVIVVQGFASSAASWAAVKRELSQVIRVYTYDRSGYGSSNISPNPPSSTTIAHELDLLLRTASVLSPYIIIAHSWGGVLSREFLALGNRKDDVAGMVFVDANQEHTLEVLDWSKMTTSPVLAGIDYMKETGILQSHKLTSEEWQVYQVIEATEKHQKQAIAEQEQYPKSFPVLASKKQLELDPPILGDRPVCVIKGDNAKDFEKLYKAGVMLGNGTGAERAAFEDILATMDDKDRYLQREILRLSSRNCYYEVAGSGHSVQLTEPGRIVDGVRWVLDQFSHC